MAARAGVAHGLKPHLTKTFKLSRDPNFVAKVRISWASTSIRPTRPWCWRSMKRAKSRPLTAPNRGCR
jgi:hypothetical protein